MFSTNLAEVRYVSKTGSNTSPFISWITASNTIQGCINVSNYGDTIYVGSGVFEEGVKMIRGLTLIGGGIDSTNIDIRSLTNEFYCIDMLDNCSASNITCIARMGENPSQMPIELVDLDLTSIRGTIEI